MNNSLLKEQKRRLRDARIRAYQTYIIFRHVRLAKKVSHLSMTGKFIPLWPIDWLGFMTRRDS